MRTLTITLLGLFLLTSCGSESGRSSDNSHSGRYDDYYRYDDAVYNDARYNDSSRYDNSVRYNNDYYDTAGTFRGKDDDRRRNKDGDIIAPDINLGDLSTPASLGESGYGTIITEYSAKSGDVVTAGELRMSRQYGFLDCQIPSGTHQIRTINGGRRGDIVHHYQNVRIRIGSKIEATLDNVVAMENTQGRWVQDVILNVDRINGKNCDYLSIRFAMPFAN